MQRQKLDPPEESGFEGGRRNPQEEGRGRGGMCDLLEEG